MRRSLDTCDVGVSVQRLETPSLLDVFQAAVAVHGSWSDMAVYLHRRAAVHVSLLTMAAAVVIASAFSAHGGTMAVTTPAGAGTDSLVLSARTAIVAHAIPFTKQANAERYIVRPDDSLSAISRRVGVSEEALLAYNGLSSSDALSVGLELRVPDLAIVSPDQLRFRDTVPHEAVPPVSAEPAPLPAQKAEPELAVHAVQSGDSIFQVAADAGVSPATVMAANDLTASSRLAIGQKLLIPSLSGTMVTTQAGDTIAGLASKYGTPAAGLLAANNLNPKTDTLSPGAKLLVPANPEAAIAIKEAATKAAEKSDAQTPAKPAGDAKPVASGGFIWPAPGSITTYFSSWHNGIDIASSSGTPVHAAQAGVVTYAGWDNTGYGYMIRIDHGDGLQTLYGHASRLLVKAGQAVDKGEVIMLMGSTGRSTGPHVHFSVFQGSGYSGLNPLRYLP